jgi:hypothetical protein
MADPIYPPPFTSFPLDNAPVARKRLIDNNAFRWLLLLALILMIVSFLMFWFGGPSFSEAGVKLSIDGPSTANVGDEVVYLIKYNNDNNVALTNLNFTFDYPDKSIIIKDGQPGQESKERFSVDKLSSGESGEKELKFFLVGNRGDIKISKVTMAYEAGDFKSDFQKESSISTTIVGLPVALTLSVPPNATSGQAINYVLDYRNESSEDLSDLKIEFDYPDGFVFQSSTPKSDSGNNSWVLNQLKRSQGSRISIVGTLNGKEGESKNISVALKRKINGAYVDYEETSSSTVIASPILGLDMTVNNSRTYSSSLDDNLNYRISYANNSNFNLIGLVLITKLEGDMFDFNMLNPGRGFFDSSNKTITWDSSSISEFANLSPGQKGLIEFSLKTKNQFGSGGTGTKNTYVKVSSRLATPNVPTGIDSDEIFVTNSLTTKISSQPTFNQTAYYNDTSFGSTGPMPPRVGQETVFSIHWQLTNPINDIANAKITATLPTGATWKGATSVTAGQPDITYNKNSSEIAWDLKNLPAGVGTSVAKYEAVFQIAIKPSLAQKGSEMDLLKNIKFSGQDSFTKQAIVITARDITTRDIVDRPSDGVVQ